MYITEADYRQALALVGDCAAANGRDEYARVMTAGLAALFRGSEVSYAEFLLRSGRWGWLDAYPTPPAHVPLALRQIREFGSEHPAVPWLRLLAAKRLPRTRTVGLEDLYTSGELSRHPYHAVFYRLRHIDVSRYAVLARSGDRVISVGVGRGRRSYDGRDADLLDLLTGPLGRAWASVSRYERLRRAVQSDVRTAGRATRTATETAAALTPAEAQVAELVGAGLGNAAVAARLGVSVKAIEQHLTRVYAKAGVRSRAQLIVALRR